MEQKRLMRWFTILWFFSLVLILLIVFVAVRDNRESVKDYVDERIKRASLEQPLPDVPEPIPGKDGKDGLNGVTTVVERKEIITLPGAPGLNGRDGINGLDGQNGKDGRQLEIQKNPETGDIETRYAGDAFWQVLIPCTDYSNKCKANGDGRAD